MSRKKRLTAQQELWSLINDKDKEMMADVLRHFKPEHQEDLCYGLKAYLLWGFKRPFTSPFMHSTFINIIYSLSIHKK